LTFTIVTMSQVRNEPQGGCTPSNVIREDDASRKQTETMLDRL